MERETLLGLMSDDTKQYADRVMEMYTAPFARFMGIEIESISRDSVTCSMYVKDEMMNSMGRGHGGVVYTLMD
ncbi:MAG: PaaI family thioesterase, partial [Candidatus Methanomethylophilaceae archaeon]|nr:PaaI family thioesterase [Candidatus Methanomethylophilaceae archaeon]